MSVINFQHGLTVLLVWLSTFAVFYQNHCYCHYRTSLPILHTLFKSHRDLRVSLLYNIPLPFSQSPHLAAIVLCMSYQNNSNTSSLPATLYLPVFLSFLLAILKSCKRIYLITLRKQRQKKTKQNQGEIFRTHSCHTTITTTTTPQHDLIHSLIIFFSLSF